MTKIQWREGTAPTSSTSSGASIHDEIRSVITFMDESDHSRCKDLKGDCLPALMAEFESVRAWLVTILEHA